MNANTITLNERRNSKKGMRISILIHIAIILLALYPFLTFEKMPEPDQLKFVEIQFMDFKSASAKSADGIKREENDAEEKVKETEEKKEVEAAEPVIEETKPEPVVEPTPEPTPQRPPVVTSNENTPPVKTSPEKPKEKVKKPLPKVKQKKVTTKPTPKPRTPTTKPSNNTSSTSTSKQTGKKNNTNSGGGEAPENGKDATQGKADSGFTGEDFAGDGLFNRKVVYRADVKKVTKEEGKIVMNLCVNRDGRVVYTKFDKDASTIKTTDVIRKALDVAKDYRFEKDYTAPEKQCGKLTFIFEIEEE